MGIKQHLRIAIAWIAAFSNAERYDAGWSRDILNPSLGGPLMLQPGFDLEEAKLLLGMAYVADLLGPRSAGGSIFPTQIEPQNDPNDPLPDDDGTTYPYPAMQIWPEGWTPAVSTSHGNVWEPSIVTSHFFVEPLKVNNAIVAYSAERDAYALSFAGTENLGGALEDISALMVSAGPLDLAGGFYKSEATYLTSFPTPQSSCREAGGCIDPLDPQPVDQEAKVHLGFRVALESMTVNAETKKNLCALFKGLGKEEIDLYITGHSLGGPIASLCAAWLRAGGIPGIRFNIKCYTFASPKPGNDAYASNFDMALTNGGYCYRIANSLDTVPQLPLTLQAIKDLNNPALINDPLAKIISLLPEKVQKIADDLDHVLGKLDFDTFNYTHVGNPRIIQGEPPVVYECVRWPKEYYPGATEAPIYDTTREWWQHWPCNYAKDLARTFKG